MTIDELLELQRLEKLKPERPYRVKKEVEIENDKRRLRIAPNTASSGTGTNQGRATAATQTVHSNFLGTLLSETIAFPPDNNGAVGPTQVVIAVNGSVKVFPKTGVTVAASTTATGNGSTPFANTFSLDADVFFSSVLAAGSYTSDLHIRYDRLSQRWFIVCIEVNTSQVNNRLLIAVSSGPTITNTSSFTFFQIAHNLIPPAGDNNTFYDYPTLGVDKNSLYLGANLFGAPANGQPFIGCNMYVINKADLMKASPVLTATAFRNSSVAKDVFTPQGVDNDDPNATEGYFIGVSNTVFSRLVLHRITYSGGVPSISADIPLNVSTTSSPRTVPYQGASPTTKRLDALDDRLFAAMIMKNKITGASTLWTTHNMNVSTTGVANNTARANGSRWYEIGNLSTTPTVVQFGTVFDATATNPKNYFIPAIAATGQGHAGIIMHSAGAASYPNVEVAGRYRTDGSGVMQAPSQTTVAAGAYNPPGDAGPVLRWGDYSQVVVDPEDNMTLWGFAQYANDVDSYGVRAVQLKAPAPPQTLSAALPVGANCGSNVALTINGTATAGSNQEFFDPGAGYTNRLSASITSPSAITVNSVTFNSVTQMTAMVNTLGKTPGTYTVRTTNPDGQSATGTFTLTGTTPSVSIAVTSGTNPTCVGSSVTFTATPTNGGTSPTYQWIKNGNNVGTGTTYTDAGTSPGTISCVMTVGTGVCTTAPTASSPTTSLTINTATTAPTNVLVSKTEVCSGTNITLTATCASGTITWYNQATGGIALGTGNNFVQSPTSNTTYFSSCENGACQSSRTASTLVLVATPTPSLTITSNITSGSSIQIANNDITATNKIVSPAKVIYRAGNYILFNTGFEAQSGSVFTTQIQGCN
ncbi:hypothetical protein GCM10011514_08530 [Emticicia aquatilis]|uniref:Ig-like domain-containing protein n=2 Tax=Emticicia aquatilis TaxID=1537369 RepID=A0A917DLT3_9BACT|nr:hypothetical protein GCM10011514_08530 [Emticicia aquatilis]